MLFISNAFWILARDSDRNRKTKRSLDEATLSAIMKEMAKPRLAASVRKGIGNGALELSNNKPLKSSDKPPRD